MTPRCLEQYSVYPCNWNIYSTLSQTVVCYHHDATETLTLICPEQYVVDATETLTLLCPEQYEVDATETLTLLCPEQYGVDATEM